VRHKLLLFASAVVFLVPGSGLIMAESKSCQDVAGFSIANTMITAATRVTPQPGWKPESNARSTVEIKVPFCRVQGTIEKEIGFELWLPDAASWNGKFLGGGVGGAAGGFNFNDLPRGVNRGYAAGTTDTGHKASDQAWMMGDPIRLTNFELRANHLLADISKQIVSAYYGKPVRYSYFVGCSGGGRQGLKEMQRFPDDYDGIISGACGPKTDEMTTRRMWEITLRDQNQGLMSAADWQLIAQEGVKACDGADGLIDGFAVDPRQCSFNIKQLQCRGEKRDDCLTSKQVEFAEKFYAPMRDENGKAIDEGLLPGIVVDSGRSALAMGTFGQAVRRDPKWNGEGFNVGQDLAALNKVMPELRADDPDLRVFKAGGGKMIMYHGWMDSAVAARMMIGYYEQVEKTMGGEAETQEFMRLYMLPGVYHCRGGPGPDQIGGSGSDGTVVDPDHDLLSALESWVEQGKAPGRIIASKVQDGKVVRTRPICPYPEYARYKGTGSIDDAANFECVRK
jgi:feruloyl esterase